jgi:tetratricopeptide (TPR) repeat protein
VSVKLNLFGSVAVVVLLTNICALPSSAENYQSVRLQTGKQIKLIGVSAGEGGQGRSSTLRYQTDRNISNKKDLAAEVDDIWDMFKPEVEKQGLTAAVISANAQPTGPDKFNQQFDFVLVRDPSGKWICLNDQIVGVGSPAKNAYRQGLKLLKQGHADQALMQFDKCISMDPQYGPAYIDRSSAHLQLNQSDKAIADANMALNLIPDNPGVYCNRGIAYWKMNQRQKALEDFSRVISMSPADHLGYMNRGAALVEMGQYENGITDLNKAISISPRIARPYHNRSLAYAKLAERDRQQAVELGHPGAHQQTASAGSTH